MTRKVLFFILAYYSLLAFSMIFQSCTYESTICNVYIIGIYDKYEDPALMLKETIIEIGANDNCTAALQIPNIGLLPSCYAGTKCVKWQNQLDIESFSLKFDQQINTANQAIPANTNILSIPEIRDMVEITNESDCNRILSRIVFTPELNDYLDFNSTPYEVTFSCSTTDGIEFEDKINNLFEE